MGMKREWFFDSSSYSRYTFSFCLGVIPYQENLPSKSSDWGLPPRWKNYILALGIFPTQAKPPFLSWCRHASVGLFSSNIWEDSSFHSDQEADRCEGRLLAIRMIRFGPGARSHALLLMVISKKGIKTYLGRLCPRSCSPLVFDQSSKQKAGQPIGGLSMTQ